MKTEDIFDSLTNNAIDFMTTSLNELKERPKYSIINFYSSIELFFKARLLKEHWALIVKNPEKAKLSSFLSGDFQSVGIDDAVARLKNITKQSITREEVQCFEKLREHRNKLVHFFNPKYVGKPDKDTLYEIISEQCKGWFYLNRLLCEKWKATFKNYKKEISELNKLMHSHKEFLRAKFEALQGRITEEKKKGFNFTDCFACSFEAAKEEKLFEPLVEHTCLVCKSYQQLLKVPCPDCENIIYIDDYAEGKCGKCNRDIDLGFLLGKYGTDTSPKEYSTDPSIAYCHWCERPEESVILLEDKEWVCLSCFQPHAAIERCDWCGAMTTGDTSDSYLNGCTMCGGELHED